MTSAGRSSGQQGRGASTPITASAACGRPVQQAWFTDTKVVVPCLRCSRKPTSTSLRTWCEQVDWLISSSWASSPTAISPLEVATVCNRRTRVFGQAGEPLGEGLGVRAGQHTGSLVEATVRAGVVVTR